MQDDATTPDRPPAVADAPLEVHGVSMHFGDRRALRDVSFSVAAGELLAIIGPNGAGKTTLLSILAGIRKPTAGSVTRSGGADTRVGWVPQQTAVYEKLSVAENLRLFARLERLADPQAEVVRMLRQTDLVDRADDELGRLSGGNRQRVNIAVGLLGDPVVLLLDEPSASLDPRQRQRLWNFITRLADRGTGVVFATHDIAEAERHAQRVLVLADGELLFSGTPAMLKAAVALEGGEDDGSAGGVPDSVGPVAGGLGPAGPQPGRLGSGGAGESDLEQAFVAFLQRKGH
ncbi:MAG TPA: ABC transporter ATP-binding protein [Solirubrobacteraceae bacterium]|nr:ABC transporter ATP-binding protein [Solirubrobacteraceae bacterium]